MGWCDKNWCNITFVVLISTFFISSLFPPVHGFQVDPAHDPQTLESLIHNASVKALANHHTGTIVNVPLPSNLKGVKASVVRIRRRTLWQQGTNFSSFIIPPKVMPFPFVRRVALVGQNLGNLSTYYYNVPGYTLVAPVVGLTAFNGTDTKAFGNVSLKLVDDSSDPILVHFPRVKQVKHPRALKCVKFLQGGLVVLSSLMNNSMCATRSDGHFSVVAPVEAENKAWMWWVAGWVTGIVGSVLVVVIGVTAYKLVRQKQIRKMERESENGVALETSSVRGARIPSASTTRTQPALEHREIP